MIEAQAKKSEYQLVRIKIKEAKLDLLIRWIEHLLLLCWQAMPRLPTLARY